MAWERQTQRLVTRLESGQGDNASECIRRQRYKDMVDQGLCSWTIEILEVMDNVDPGGFRTEESGRKRPSVSGLGLVTCTMTQRVSGYVRYRTVRACYTDAVSVERLRLQRRLPPILRLHSIFPARLHMRFHTLVEIIYTFRYHDG